MQPCFHVTPSYIARHVKCTPVCLADTITKFPDIHRKSGNMCQEANDKAVLGLPDLWASKAPGAHERECTETLVIGTLVRSVGLDLAENQRQCIKQLG